MKATSKERIARALHGGAEGALGRARRSASASRASWRVALHDRNRVEHLGGDRAGVGDAVLAGARQLAHAAAEIEATAAPPAPGCPAPASSRSGLVTISIAIAPMPITALRRPIDRLEPTTVWTNVVSVVRRDSTSPVWVVSKNSGLCVHDVRVDGVAQVGGDPLAEPAHHVEARGREDAQRHADAEQGEEMLAQRHHAGARVGGDEALVDQAAQRHRKDQRAGRRPAPGTRPARTIGRGTGAGRAAGRRATRRSLGRRGVEAEVAMRRRF